MVLTFVKRATSPLNFEPIDTPPEDILYPGSDQEDEYDEKKRAKRKLRVELLGRQYLEGRPLFIQSAGLKGPFERGWVNPWASKKRKRGIDGIQRSYGTPATKEDGFRRSTEAEKGSSTVKRTSVKDSEFVQSTSDLHKRASTATGLAEQEGYTAKRRRHEQREEPNGDHDASKSISAGASTTQQGSWLKTNQTYLQRNVRNDRKSPTPTPATRDRVQKNATPPPSKLQSQMTPIPKVPHVQRKSGQPSGFTPINGPSESKDKANPLAKTTKVLSRSVQHDNGDRHDSAYIRVKEMDLATANEVTRRGYEEVKRLSQEAVRQTALDDRNHQAKRLSQEAVSGAHRSSARDSSRLQPYVSEVVTIDDECTTAGLRAKSRAPRPSPHAVPMSIYQPDFQYRYAAKSSSSGSSREKAPFFKATEEIQSRARATSSSSSSSGSDAFAEALEAAQAKAGSKSLVSSHSSSPAVEGLETTSVKKNTNGIRRLIFTPSGSAKFAQRRTLARPSSSSSAAGPTISPLQDTENKASAFKGNALARKESAKSSDLPISNGGYSRSSAVLPEAQVAGDALIQHSQKPSGPSTSLLETEKPSPKFPSLDEGDSYVNLSTQAAFLKAQRSFKDEVLKSLKDSPLESKIVKTSPGASKQSGPDATTPANGGRLHGTISRWKDVTSQDTEDEEVMSTQAMVDAMSPFAITTVKRRPPLNERTSLAPSPTMRNPSMSTPTLSPDLPAVSALRDHHPPPSFNESLAQKFLLGFYGPHQQMPTNSDLESKAHIRPRHIACNNCRKNKVSIALPVVLNLY